MRQATVRAEAIAHPFLKWAGGKTALLPEILPRLPKKIKTYYEPFVGGGAVFFALAAEEGRFKRAVLGDANQELMRAYVSLALLPDQVILFLKEGGYDHNEKRYYEIRSLNPWQLSESERAARLIYLNRTCFNGLYRVNKKGQFNVPFGRYTNPTICDEENIRAVSAALDKADFRAIGLLPSGHTIGVDFELTVEDAKRGDAVYMDPPYVPVSATSNFTAYGKDGFGPKDQERLRDVAARLVNKGVHVLLSNSDTSFVWQLYDRKGFKIEKVRAPRRINSKGGKRGDVGELLISGRL